MCSLAMKHESWFFSKLKMPFNSAINVVMMNSRMHLCFAESFRRVGQAQRTGNSTGHRLWRRNGKTKSWNQFPKSSEEVDFGGDFLDGRDFEQILGFNAYSHITTPPLNFQSAYVSHGAETTASFSDTEKILVGAGEQLFCEPEPFDETNLYDLLFPSDMNVNLVKHEVIGESSKSGNPEEAAYLLDKPFLDSSEYFPFGEEWFIETNYLSNPAEANTADLGMLGEYLTFFDASNDNYQYFSYDPSIIPSEDPVSTQTFLPQKELNERTEQAVIPGGLIPDYSNVHAASSSHKQVAAKYQSDLQYPFMEQASQMLSNIPAKPAFASECPSKDSTIHFNFSRPSSNPLNVTAGMIQIQNLTVGNNGTTRPFKHENLNITVTFGFSRGDDGSANLRSNVSIHPGKILSTISRDLFYIFLGVLVLSMRASKLVCIFVLTKPQDYFF